MRWQRRVHPHSVLPSGWLVPFFLPTVLLPMESPSSLGQRGCFLPRSHEGEPFESLPSRGQGCPVRSSPAALQVREWKDLVTLGLRVAQGAETLILKGSSHPPPP